MASVRESGVRERLRVHGVAPPCPRTALSRTLARTLGFLRPGGPVRDVLLFAQTGRFVNYGAGEPECRGHPPPSFVRPADFALVVAAVDRRVHGSAGVSWATPPASGATGRVFVATLGGRMVMPVEHRHRSNPWDDVSLPALRAQLDDAYARPPGWAARYARRNPVRSDFRYP